MAPTWTFAERERELFECDDCSSFEKSMIFFFFLYLKCISEVKLNQSKHYTEKTNTKGKMHLRTNKSLEKS